MNSPKLNDPVHCAVLGLKDGPVIYYGRAALSGDWYIALDGATPEQIATLEKEAHEEDELTIWHPYGPLMFRLDWLAEGSTDPELWKNYRVVKRQLETVSPLAQN
jgi:hypothetical protein